MTEANNFINIQDAASMLGVTTATLRNWDKGGKLKAIRHPMNNYRVYRLEDVVSLLNNENGNDKENYASPQKSVNIEKNADSSLLDLKRLKIIVRQMSKAFRDSEGGSIMERFEEISKLLFCKMFDEQEVEKNEKNELEFQIAPQDTIDSVYLRISTLFGRSIAKYSTIFTNGRSILSSDKKAIFEIVKLLQNYNFSKVPVDIKGTVYEEIICNTFDKSENQQFFTPRNIVEFMVQMVNPTIKDTVCDPACGSGGFLIYTLMWNKNHPFNKEMDIDQLIKSYCSNKLIGVEIDSRMAWVSNMNIIMHGGDGTPVKYIPKGGSLSWNKEVSKILKLNSIDIIITNPPFGSDFSDKDSLDRYSVGKDKSSRRRGVLFVERCLDILKPGGKLAIILDESILNGSTNSDIRELIFKKAIIEAIISLPDVTFLPYSSAKASILLLKKKKLSDGFFSQKEIFMANIENVGKRPNGDSLYGSERDDSGKLKLLDDLPLVVTAWRKFKAEGKFTIQNLSPFIFICDPREFFDENGRLVESRLDIQFHHPSKKIAKDSIAKSIYPMPTLAELVIERNKTVLPKVEFPDEVCRFIGLANIMPDSGEYFVSELIGDQIKSSVRYFKSGDILFSKLRPELRKCIFIDDQEDEGFTSSECFVFRGLDRAAENLEFSELLKNRKTLFNIDSEYLAYLLRSDIVFGQIVYQVTGVGRPRIPKSSILSVKIPLPPINEQKEIVRLFKDAHKRRLNLKRQSKEALNQAEETIRDIYSFVQKKLCPD